MIGKKHFKFLYLGFNKKFIDLLSNSLTVKYNDLFTFDFTHESPSSLNKSKIHQNEYDGILYDMNPSFDNKIYKFIKKFNTYHYPKSTLTLGLFEDLNEETQNWILKNPPHFAFRASCVNLDEVQFVSFSMASFLLQKHNIPNNYVLAKVMEEAFVQVPFNVKVISENEVVLESTCNLTLPDFMCKLNSIRNIINFNTRITNYSVASNPASFTHPYLISLKFELLTELDKENIKKDIVDFLKRNKDIPKDDKEFVQKKFQVLYENTAKEKINKFSQWLKRNPEFAYDLDYRMKAIIISSTFADEPSTFINENIIVYTFKRTSKDLIEKIKAIKPKFIFYEFDAFESPSESSPEEMVKTKDLVHSNNLFKSLKYLKDEVGTSQLSDTKLVLLSNDSMTESHISSNINYSGFTFFNKSTSKEFLDEYFTHYFEENDPNIIKYESRAFINDSFSCLPLEISIPIVIQEVSEKEAFIACKSELPINTPFKLSTEHYDIMLTIIPSEYSRLNKYKEDKQYKCIVNCVDEQSRQRLRSYVIKYEKRTDRIA